MPVTPYPITGTVKDVDGSTAFYPGSIKIIDVTLGQSVTGSMAPDGSFSVDVAGMPTYTNGDALQIVIYNSAQTKSTEFRHTVNTGLPGYDAGTLYMHWTKPFLGTATLMAGIVSNKDDSAEYTIDLYDRKNDAKLLSMDVSPNNSIPFSLLFKGIPFSEGICIIRESDASNKVEVQLVVK
jgi:hypothetical protein